MPDPYWMDPEVEDAILERADQRRDIHQGMAANANLGLAARVVELSNLNPAASPGVVVSAAQEGLSDEQFVEISKHDGGGGDFMSGIGDFFGAGVKKATGLLDNVADFTYEQVIKPTVRGAFTISEAGAEAVQAPFAAGLKTVRGDGSFGTNWQAAVGQSEGIQALSGFTQGNFDIGKGLFVGGEPAERAQRVRERNPVEFGNELVSAFSGEVLQEGDIAHDVISGVTQFAADVLTDPFILASGGASKLRNAAKLLDEGDVLRASEALGAVNSSRRSTALIETAEDVLKHPGLTEELAKADSYTIFKSFRLSPANQINHKLISRLGDADEADDVAEILLQAVRRGGGPEGGIMEKGFYSGFGNVRKRVRNLKFSGAAPKGEISSSNLDGAAEKIDGLLKQARVPERVTDEAGELVGGRAKIFDDLARLDEGDNEAFFDVVTDAMSAVGRQLRTAADDGGRLSRLWGDPDEMESFFRRATKLVNDEGEAFRLFANDDLANPIRSPFTKTKQVVNAAGDEVEVLLPTPLTTSQLADISFTLPNVQDIRRAATEFGVLRRVYQSQGWDMTESALRFVTKKLFKPLAIFRPAYIVRIGFEEQARMAGYGYDTLLNNPVKYLQANVMGRSEVKTLSGKNLINAGDELNALGRTATHSMADPVAGRAHLYSSISKGSGSTVDEIAENTKPEYIDAWRRELGQLFAAPEMRKMAQLRNTDQMMRWLRNTDEGKDVVNRIARINDQAGDLLQSDRALRQWVNTLDKYLTAKTGNNSDLLDLVANGKIGDTAFKLDGSNASKLNSVLKSNLDAAPPKVKISRQVAEGGDDVGHLDRLLNLVADYTATKPSAILARFPAMRQDMVRISARMMKNASDDALRREVFDAAKKNFNMTKKELKTLRSAMNDASGVDGAISSFDEFDDIVTHRAAEHAKDLLYDTTRRGAYQDAFEAVFPFFDAYVEVMGAWGKILKNNPGFFMKGMQGYHNLKNEGVFYVNDFGEEVFAYPGGGMLSRLLPGVEDDASLKLEGRVEGLNLVLQSFGPGFGPVAQWGAGAFLPDSPDADKLRDLVIPFGSPVDRPGELANPKKLAESIAPAWAKKGINAFSSGSWNETQWNSAVGDVMSALATTGQYKPGDRQDRQRLMDDAASGARWTLFLRSLVQFTGPTGPNGTWEVKYDSETKDIPPESELGDGVWHTIRTYADEYRRLFEKFQDHQLATNRFIEMYGHEPYYLTQAKSQGTKELPLTEQGDKWLRDHRDLVDEYPASLGFFAPSDEGDEFDYGAYARQIEEGDRQSLSGDQQLQLANQTKARAMYANVKNLTENMPSNQRQFVRSKVKDRLDQEFPGWQFKVLGVKSAPTMQQQIDELSTAAFDPALSDSPVTDPLRAYMTVRSKLLDVVEARGGQQFGASRDADLLVRLDAVGQALAQKYPQFKAVWTELLMREVRE